MKKILIVLGLAVIATGCTRPHDISHEIAMPPGFKDCTVGVTGHNLGKLYMIRCPNSSTTIIADNKHDKPTVTIDGVEYIQK